MLKECKEVILEAFPGFIIDTAYDYGDIIVFNLVPRDYTRATIADDLQNSSFSVDKKTKEIKAFFPFDLPLEVYQNGKKVM